MNKRPPSVTAISFVFAAAGVIGLVTTLLNSRRGIRFSMTSYK
jgi:hypothetical protein